MNEREFRIEVVRALRNIERLLEPHQFTLRLENDMAIGNIAAGSTGTFTATLLLNGQPYVPADGSTYVFNPTFSANDPDVTLTPAAAAGDAESVVAAVPAASADTSLSVGVSVVAPDGTTLTAADTVTITPAPPQVFTLSLTQTA